MNTCDEFRAIAVALVILQEQFTCLLVQSRLWVRINEEALDGDKNVTNSVCGFPVFLQSVDANLSITSNIGMEDLCCKPTWIQESIKGEARKEWAYI
jgi:hypothetical protein